MAQLRLDDDAFSVGNALFQDHLPAAPDRSPRIFVRITIPGLDQPFLALLDTGAEYSVLGREIAVEAGLAGLDGDPIRLRHKEGITSGKLVRTIITIMADDGDALDVEAMIMIPEDDSLGSMTFIGYIGFLERVRLGLDPQANQIYFGGY